MELSELPVETQLEIMLADHYRFQYLVAACRAGLFVALENEPGLCVKDIAQRLNLEEQPARILVLGCTVLGLLRKEGQSYYNTPLTKGVSGDYEGTMTSIITRESRNMYRALTWLPESVQENTNVGLRRVMAGSSDNLYERLTENAELEAEFHTMMAFHSRKFGAAIKENLDLSGYRHLLDVGGGTAANAENLADRWPDLHMTIADLPSVAATAKARVEELGLADRVQVAGIDAFSDEFPSGCDAVLFAHFLEIWSPERIQKLLAKAYRALPPGGGLFIIAPYQHDDETGPVQAAYLSAYFLAFASGEGMVYTGKEFEQWLGSAGFELTSRTVLGMEEAIMLCARKPS
ncbi:methyltransferase [Streptomyces sp. NPDC059063]|uniref:methyltransferase n=1 Tax=unclassified Streptomyces TaxID=2593676 RepID=UPI0036A47C89